LLALYLQYPSGGNHASFSRKAGYWQRHGFLVPHLDAITLEPLKGFRDYWFISPCAQLDRIQYPLQTAGEPVMDLDHKTALGGAPVQRITLPPQAPAHTPLAIITTCTVSAREPAGGANACDSDCRRSLEPTIVGEFTQPAQ